MLNIPRKFASPVAFLVFLFWAARLPADVVELASGAKLEGEVTERNEDYVIIKIKLGGRTSSRKCPLDRVHAITIGDQREVLNPKAGKGGKPSAGGSKADARSGAAAAADTRRTAEEIDALIDREGRTPPDWWDSVPLEYPETLDLSWEDVQGQPWDNQKNVGQYVWDIINPNPDKWRSGVRLLHHLLSVHKDHPQTRQKVMEALGRMYYNLLQDHARAAFWWRQAGVDEGGPYRWSGVCLAECYWKLGNRQMATDLLDRVPPQFAMIKLWADMGETRRALRMADANLRGQAADVAGIYGGDACRVAGQHRQALQYYGKVLAVPAEGNAKGRIEQNHKRARANIEAIKLFDLLDLSRVPDGTYRASSPGYAGELEVAVTVRGGRIEAVQVVAHQEKQFYSSIAETPRKIVEKQGVKGIDATSGATITSEAIINATAKALSEGME